MPLVVPGINSALGGGNKQSEWENKLLGKKIGHGTPSNETTFAKTDLPEEHRVLEHGSFATADHKENRLNVHLAEDGTVAKVNFG